MRLITLPEHDVFNYTPPSDVYGILAAPTCTHFSLARTRAKTPRDLKTAMELVKRILEIIWECQYKLDRPTAHKTTLAFWAIENPRGFLRYFLGKPTLEFQPWQYGNPYTKRTHLWGHFGIPKQNVVDYDKDSFNYLSIKEYPLPDAFVYDKGCGLSLRQVRRSITPSGFAEAFFKANR